MTEQSMKAEIASVSETGDLHSLMADSVTVWGWSQVTRECWSSRANREMWCGEHSMKCEALSSWHLLAGRDLTMA